MKDRLIKAGLFLIPTLVMSGLFVKTVIYDRDQIKRLEADLVYQQEITTAVFATGTQGHQEELFVRHSLTGEITVAAGGYTTNSEDSRAFTFERGSNGAL